MPPSTDRLAPRDHAPALGSTIPASAARPYSPATSFAELVFVSGQLPLDLATGELVAGGIVEHTERVMRNLQTVLLGEDSDTTRLLRTTVYLTTRRHWAAMNEVYLRHVAQPPPARTTVIVAELGFGALVEVDAIAYRTPPPATGA